MSLRIEKSEKTSKKYLQAVDDEEYEMLKLLVRGKFSKPIKERTRKEKSAVVKFWRNRSKFEVREDSKLYFDGKEVLTKSALKKVIDKTLDESDITSSRKFREHVAGNYAGFSERAIQSMIAKKNRHARQSTKGVVSTSKSSKKGMKAEEPMSHFNLYLLKEISTGGRTSMISILMDAFSKFTWVNVLTEPTGFENIPRLSHNLTYELERIFSEHGTPGFLQIFDSYNKEQLLSNQIIESCKAQNVPCLRTDPEIIDQITEIKCDIMKIFESNIDDWRFEVLRYTKNLNNLPRQDLDWKKAFDLFHSRPYTYEIKQQDTTKEEVPSFSRPTLIDIGHEQREFSGDIDVTDRQNTPGYHVTQAKSPTFQNTGETIPVYQETKNTEPGYLEKRESTTELQKAEETRDLNKYNELFRKHGFSIPCLPEQRYSQFWAICDQLSRVGVQITESEMRQGLVDYLEQNRNDQEGLPYEVYTGKPWSEYLPEVLSGSFNGDQVTLETISNRYEVRIILVNANGIEQREIEPPFTSTCPEDPAIHTVYIGYVADAFDGVRYFSLSQTEATTNQLEHDFADTKQLICQTSTLNLKKYSVLPQLCIPNPDMFMVRNDGRIVCEVMRFVNYCGPGSDAVEELKNILNVSLWKFAWLELCPKGESMYEIKNISFEFLR